MTEKTFALTIPTKLGAEMINFAKVQQPIKKTPSDAWKNGIPAFRPKNLTKISAKNVSERKEYQKWLADKLLQQYLEEMKAQQTQYETLQEIKSIPKEEIKSITTEDQEILGEGTLHCAKSIDDLPL